MADTLLFRGGSSASIDVANVQSREIVIDTDTDQIVSGPSRRKTVMEESNGDVKIGGTLPSAPNITLNANGSITAGPYNGLPISRDNNFNIALGDDSQSSSGTNFFNISCGYKSLYSNVTGNSNIAIGYRALESSLGYSNIAIGFKAGFYIEGNNNTIIGAYEGTAADASLSNTVIISAGATERARCNSSGTWQFAGPVSIGGTAAANTIEEYEDGTWLPVPYGSTTAGTFTSTPAVQTGGYVRIGRTCTIWCRIQGALTGAAGDLRIGGLPFAARWDGGAPQVNVQSQRAGTIVGYQSLDGFPSTGNAVYAQINNYNDYVRLIDVTSQPGTTLDASLTTNPSIFFTLTYRILQ